MPRAGLYGVHEVYEEDGEIGDGVYLNSCRNTEGCLKSHIHQFRKRTF